MANIDKTKYTYNKQIKDTWEINVDEHNPNLNAKRVDVVLKNYITFIDIDSNDENIMYIGKANITSNENEEVWQIKKIIFDGNKIKILWADGNDNFDNSWTDREVKNYS